MNNELKSSLDQFDEITYFELTEDEDFEFALDDLDLSDASDNKTVLD